MNPINELFRLTDSLPQGTPLEDHDRAIQKLCVEAIHSPDKSKFCPLYPLLKRRYDKLNEEGFFRGTPLAKAAFKDLLAELAYIDIAAFIEKDRAGFAKFARAQPGKVFDNPAIRARVLEYLAFRRPELFFHLIDLIDPSLEEAIAITEFICRNHGSFIGEAVEMLRNQEGFDQKMLTEIFVRVFPQHRIHELHPAFLERFILHQHGPERQQEMIDRFGKGICKGHAMAMLSQNEPNPALIESQGRFLQASSHMQVEHQHHHLMVLGEELLGRRDELPLLFGKIKSIYGIAEIEHFPPDRIAACAKRLIKDPEFRLALQAEVEVIDPIIAEVEEEYPSLKKNELPPSLLVKRGLFISASLCKNTPLSQFLQRTTGLGQGDFLLEIHNSQTGLGHGMYISPGRLCFCDINDRDPQSLLPIMRRFSSPQELWAYVNAHVHIFYKGLGMDVFTVQHYLKVAL